MERHFFIAVLLALATSAAAQSFQGDGLTVELSAAGDTITGHVTRDGARFPLTAKPAAGGRMDGTFTANGSSFEFTATRDGDGLVFRTGTKTYRLKAVAAPAAIPDTLTFGRVEIRDVHMDNRVSHTMYVPQGWSFKGGVHWSEGTIVYPQKTIEVVSPDGYAVRFTPALYLGYSEMDPNFAMQLKQNGLWDPRQHQERSGIPPPTDIGQFMVGFMQRNNPAISDVRLVDQRRDRDGEEAMKKAMGDAAPSGQLHVVNVEYKRNGVAIREEINLQYYASPPVRGPSTLWQYMITTDAIVSGPAEGFAAKKPLLYGIAKSLQTVPNWDLCKNNVLVAIQNARHQANMQQIQQWGEAIRKAGQEYSKMSDAQMKSWKEQQKVDDRLQRDRINRIYDLYTVTDTEGNRIVVPLGYPHLYKTNDGKFIASKQQLSHTQAQGLTPVEAN
ncbi:hypothetical protein [Humisphaera borealis]|uniref:Uncharacterized protein n=1 Tax=Humisphaera borealis TaxID=2807512 RepID=A0A7M2WPY4_9BACT|nr:hypothetical protein [Humisphaera borealis]QOV87585.1 hypothetical protein IPV69_14945 [Humisphaera borealis]